MDKTVDRDLSLIKDLGLKLIYAMNTHVHADHVTGTSLIKVGVLLFQVLAHIYQKKEGSRWVHECAFPERVCNVFI